MSVTLAAWHALWRELGAASGDEALFHRLVAAYSERHRHYHTLQHLRECLAQFEGARALAARPAEVGLPAPIIQLLQAQPQDLIQDPS